MLHLMTKLAKPFRLCILLLSMVTLFAASASQNAAAGKAAEETKLTTDIVTKENAESTTITVKGNQKLTAQTSAQAFAAETEVPEPEAKQAASEKTLEPAEAPAPPATRMKSVWATPRDKNVVITVRADGTITNYRAFTIRENPPRIVYDIYELKSPFKAEQRIAVKSDQVRKIRHFGHPDKIRIVLETNKNYLSKHTARPINNGLLIYVGQAPQTVSEDPPETFESQAGEPMPADAEESQTVKYEQLAWLNRIDFEIEEAGKSAITIGTTRPVKYQVIKIDSKRLHLKLLKTNLTENRKHALITTSFQSAVDRITPTDAPEAKETVVDIELREGVPYFVKQTNNAIRVNFSPSKIPPRTYEDAKLPDWKKVPSEPVTAPGKS